ncbi:hypothetical protein [Agromyces sp. NPDC058064]|uniref:hypothetical protein n=1 Tax=Agromyces sp. NPDC058064 TaxID=3346322 RepID=UPI0036DEFE01
MGDAVNETRSEARPEREAAIRGLVLGHVEESRERDARRRRHRWFAWGGGGLVVSGIAATAAVVWLQSQLVSNDQLIHCFRAEALPDGDRPDAMAYIAFSDGAERAEHAVEVCTMMWEQGSLESGFDPTSLTNPSGVVPESFVLCRMGDGSTAVVPSSGPAICSRLGLALLEPGDE